MNYEINAFDMQRLENLINDFLANYKEVFMNYQKGTDDDLVCVFKENTLKDFLNAIIDVLIILKIDYKIENDKIFINMNEQYYIDDERIEDLIYYIEKVSNECKMFISKYRAIIKGTVKYDEDVTTDSYLQAMFYKMLAIHYSLSTISIKMCAEEDSVKVTLFKDDDEVSVKEMQEKIQELMLQRDQNIIARMKLKQKIEDINNEISVESKKIKLAKSNKTIYDDESYEAVVEKITSDNFKIKNEFEDAFNNYRLELQKNLKILDNIIKTAGVSIAEINEDHVINRDNKSNENIS